MKILLTKDESEAYFFNALCNGLGYVCGYGVKLDYSDSDYKSSRERLTTRNESSNSTCFEDVIMEILRGGGSITLVDIEGEGDMTRTITLADIHARVANSPLEALTEMAMQEDDANTADMIIQTVFFNEILFG